MLEPLYTEAQVQAAVRRTAAEVLACYGAEHPVTVLVLLNGALWFAADLLRLLPPNFRLETVRVSSYGNARETSGRLAWQSPPPPVQGRRVLVVDDVLDSGITLQSVCAVLREQGALAVHTAVAVVKEGCRRVPFEADFAALHADGSAFLVGYGMDAAGQYRNLPYIACVR